MLSVMKSMAGGLVAVAMIMAASGAVAAPKKVASVEGITEYTLDNGLRVLLFPDSSRPTVTVNLTVLVGSRHEGYGEAGMAHLLEHMVFKGTPTHANIPKLLSERGAQFNGTTSDDRTNYFETLPASDENLEFALRLEADRFVNSLIRQEDLLSEFTVVRNEFERGENSPSRVLFQRISATAYEWHNYGKSTIGNRSDIERVPIAALRAFYEKYYQPDNAILVVAGKFEEATALRLVQTHFGAIPRPARELPKTYTVEPPQDGERTVTLRRVGDVALAGVAYHVCAGSHPDFAAVSVLARILSAQPSGRLYKALVEPGIASSVFGFAQARHDPTLLLVGAEIAKERSPDDALAALLRAAEAVGEQGPTEEETARARQQLLKDWELASANTTGIAVSLSSWASQGDWRLYFLYRDRVEQVKPDDVRAVAARYLQRANRTVGLFLPSEASQRVEVPETPDVGAMVKDYKGRAAVAAGEAFDVAPAAIEARTKRARLANGLKTALLPKKTRGETVSLTLRLRYGDVKSLAGRATAAEFLPELMARGAKDLPFQQLRDALDREKTQLSASGDAGIASFSLRTKRENLPAAVGILNRLLREPALAGEELEVLKREQLTSIEQTLSDPQALASNAIRRALVQHASDDPRYVPTGPEEVTRVKALRVEDVRGLHGELLNGHNGELAVVGDFDPAALAPLLDTLDSWKSSAPYTRLTRELPARLEYGKQVIQTPDKANAIYLAASLMPLSNSDPDYPALVIANYILGGGSLSSRLGDRVRQKEGLSYGVGSGFSALSLDKRASWQIQAITNPLNIGKVETAIREEVEKLLKDGVTAEEVTRAKSGYLQQQQVVRASDERLAGLLADTLYESRTMAYFLELEKAVQGLDVAQITETARKHWDPKKMVLVTAGDFAKSAGK